MAGVAVVVVIHHRLVMAVGVVAVIQDHPEVAVILIMKIMDILIMLVGRALVIEINLISVCGCPL